MRPLRDIATAVRLLSVVPIGGAEGERPVAWFGWVGWLYTGVAVAIAWLAGSTGLTTGIGSLFVAVLVVASWAGLSGFLHWDGLADAADGLGVRGDATRKLAVMKDSTIGAFGVVAIVFVALLQVTSLAVAVDAGSRWVLAAPVFGRVGAALALWFRRPASSTGLAARYASRPGAVGGLVLAASLVPLLAVSFPPSGPRIILFAAGITFASLVPGVFARRLGGVNGDVLGATILLSETFMLVGCALAGGYA